MSFATRHGEYPHVQRRRGLRSTPESTSGGVVVKTLHRWSFPEPTETSRSRPPNEHSAVTRDRFSHLSERVP